MRGSGGERCSCARPDLPSEGMWPRAAAMKERSREGARGTRRDFIKKKKKGAMVLNIYPESDVIRMRSEASPTVEGHIAGGLGIKR